MKEKLQVFARTLLANADRTTTAVLGIICLATLGLYLQEQSRGEIQPPEPPPTPWQKPIPNDDYERLVKSYINVNEDISQDPKVRRLIEFNMFDLKSVKAEEALAKQWDAQLDEAERLMQAGKKEDALKILDSVLARKPDLVRALDLRNQIIPQPSPSPSPTATP